MKHLLTGLLLLVAAVSLPAAGGDRPPIVPAMTAVPPLIDGTLDDAAWRDAKVYDGFFTTKPSHGKPASEKTEFMVSYDRSHLYFAFHCHDSEPTKIKTSLAKRDSFDGDDWIGVAIDTFRDQQSGYIMVCNPQGIQMDGTINQDGNADTSYDLIWHSAGRITADGYIVEMAVPFKSLRYPFRPTITMGLWAVRTITRRSEQSECPETLPEGGSLLSQMIPLELSGIRYERTMEFLPAVTWSQGRHRDGGAMVSGGQEKDLSLTGKLGLTSNLTLDATYNPDFSQVEADAGQIDFNLRSSLNLEEKRSFFLEGKEQFNIAARMEANPLNSLVYTRSIVDPILGVKLTGKLGGRNMVAGLFALDEYQDAGLRAAGREEEDARFAALRYKRVLSQDSYIGAFYTGRGQYENRNQVVGGDGRLRLDPRHFLEYHAMASFSRGEAANHTGGALGLRYNYSSRRFSLETGYVDIGRDFRLDTGYVGRTGVRMVPFFAWWAFYPRSSFFQRIETFYWSYHTQDTSADLFETTNVFALNLHMPRQSFLRVDGTLANEVFAGRRFPRNGWRVMAETQIVKQLYISVNLRQNRSIFYDSAAPYAGRTTSFNLDLIFQPTDQINSRFSLRFAEFLRWPDREKVYDYTILRNRTTFQFNKYLFLRAIVEYNSFRRTITGDFLASFTYIPGTVVYFGYGSLYERPEAGLPGELRPNDAYRLARNNFFFKASYLLRF